MKSQAKYFVSAEKAELYCALINGVMKCVDVVGVGWMIKVVARG